MSDHTDKRIKNVVIVGGGTAGWMTAAALSKVLPANYSKITLVESDAIGTVGVGEATIPQIATFNQLIGIDEDDFVKATQGTFKLGIQFNDWGQLGDSYIHPFGVFGAPIGELPFHHYWLKLHQQGHFDSLDSFALACTAAPKGKFTRPLNVPKSPLSQIIYAFQFDAGLYAKYLRALSEGRGVSRLEGKVVQVHQNNESGFIESVELDNAAVLSGDLFIDCSGFRGLLIEQTLKTGYREWSHWLPCDRAVAVPCASKCAPDPYTRSTARKAGWQWRIPLQHRTGNGHVYSSQFMEDQEAEQILLDNLDGEPLADLNRLRFCTGRRTQFWNKNVVAIGLSSGFIEPLESTSIHLIQSGISKLIGLFPDLDFAQSTIDKYNDQSVKEIEAIRDFIIAHYKATQRTDSEFWNYCRTMSVPDSLQEKLDLFASSGRLYREGDELFSEVSWLAILFGQNIRPHTYHPLVDTLNESALLDYMKGIEDVIARSVDSMPSHQEFIDQHCKAAAVS
ncbi:MAG: tryptophan 7-halogenase [Acidiferrobacterales bacterium]|nr:tryptophan 7-halogenase [Acidiferrobacterales bacterium]